MKDKYFHGNDNLKSNEESKTWKDHKTKEQREVPYCSVSRLLRGMIFICSASLEEESAPRGICPMQMTLSHQVFTTLKDY